MNAYGSTRGVAALLLGAFVGSADAMPLRDLDVRTLVLPVAEEATGTEPKSNTAEPSGDRIYLGNEPLESCMKRWDPGTHMTKEAWRASCQRITEERGPYVQGR